MALQNARLPQEILETVIDEAAGSTDFTEKEIQETLRACSFVCYAFRNRAYRNLFCTLHLIQHPFCCPSKLLTRIWDLREIVHAGHVLGMSSLLYFTRSFKLVMDGGSAYDTYVILKNEDLAKIMHLLCKYTPAIHTVALAGSNSVPISWPDLSRDFQEGFGELIRVRTVRNLCLDNIGGVPDTMLRGTNVRHIRFHRVKLFIPIEPFCGLSQTNELTDIDIDYTFPFPLPPPSSSSSADSNMDDNNHESFPVSPSQAGLCLSSLRSLKYTSYHPEDFHKFTNIALSFRSLEKIHIVFSDSTSMFFPEFSDALLLPLPSIPFGSLPRLRTLGICHRSPIAVGMGINSRIPLLKVLDLLGCGMGDSVLVLPPALDSLVLGFVVRTHAPWMRVDEFFPERKMWGMLDRLLSPELDTPETTRSESERGRLPLGDGDWQHHHLPRHHENGNGNRKPVTVKLRLQYITLPGKPWAFNERVFGERCRSFLGDVFPRLMGCGARSGEREEFAESESVKRGAKLEVDVSVFPLGRNVDILGWDV